MLSKIPTLSWVQSHVGAIMGWKVQQRWIEGTQHQVFTRVHETGGDRVGESCVSVFPYLYPPVTTPKTDALYVLTVCRRSFCLFHCVFFCLCCFFFLHPCFHISPLLWRLPRCTQTTALSQSALFDDLHYILFAWRYSGLTCCVCINCGVNDSNKREAQPYWDGNESA